MSDLEMQPIAEPVPQQEPGLTQMQRVTNIFVAPAKTFEDIKRGNKSWWMPLIIGSIAAYIFFFAVYTKVGIPQVVENQIHLNPKQEEKLAQIPPDQRELQVKIQTYITEGIFIANPVMAMAFGAIIALVLWGTINFGFGGKAKFTQVFAVWFYAGLPGIFKATLTAIVLYAGAAPEAFNLNNPSPTNLGIFFNPYETNRALYVFASWIDIVSIWNMVLLGMGLAIVAGVKRNSGYIAVFGWWALCLLVTIGIAAAFS